MKAAGNAAETHVCRCGRESVLAIADIALYKAKDAGRNCVSRRDAAQPSAIIPRHVRGLTVR
jgi:hypothetical protein